MGQSALEKREYWLDVMRRQQESGQTVRGFCRHSRLSEPSFYSWRRKLAGEQQKASKTKNDKQNPPADAPTFIPLRLSAAGGNVVEIVHPRGHVVRVPVCFEWETLRQILGLLDEPKGA